MLALIYSMNALYSEDYTNINYYIIYYQMMLKWILKLTSDYWKQFETKLPKFQRRLMMLIKSNNPERWYQKFAEGRLLLAYYKK